jgi:hypothetical protein
MDVDIEEGFLDLNNIALDIPPHYLDPDDLKYLDPDLEQHENVNPVIPEIKWQQVYWNDLAVSPNAVCNIQNIAILNFRNKIIYFFGEHHQKTSETCVSLDVRCFIEYDFHKIFVESLECEGLNSTDYLLPNLEENLKSFKTVDTSLNLDDYFKKNKQEFQYTCTLKRITDMNENIFRNPSTVISDYSRFESTKSSKVVNLKSRSDFYKYAFSLFIKSLRKLKNNDFCKKLKTKYHLDINTNMPIIHPSNFYDAFYKDYHDYIIIMNGIGRRKQQILAKKHKFKLFFSDPYKRRGYFLLICKFAQYLKKI